MKPETLRAVAALLAASAVVVAGAMPMKVAALPRPAASPPPVTTRMMTAITDTDVTSAEAVTAVATTVGNGASSAISTVTQTIPPLETLFSLKVPFGSIILREAKKNDLAPELVAAVIKQESEFIPTARSPRGALGLMQLLPSTGRWMGAYNLMNPEQNIAAGARYLKYLSDQFGGNEQKMIAAYNAGEGNVRRYDGLPPFRETRTYVRNVLQFREELVRSEIVQPRMQPPAGT